jgi:hypothetical protein
MDDKLKTMSFKDFTVVNPSMTDDEYLAYQAQKRRRGHFDTQGESVEHALGTVEEKTLHINLDAKDSPRQKQVTSVLKRHEKSGAIEFDGETDKGALFKINKPGVEKSINKELSRLGGGYQLGESVEQVDEADLSKMDHAEFMKYGDSNPKGRADPAWNAERKKRYKKSQASMYRKMKKEEVEQVDEVMDRTARIKASQRMKRMSKRIQMAKKRALKRAPSTDVVKSRAQRQARNQMMTKYTKGVPKSELSMARRAELEKKLNKQKGRVDKMAKKLIPTIRKQDRERRSGANKEK